MILFYLYDVTSPPTDVPLGNRSDTLELEYLSMVVFGITFVASVISIISAIVFVRAFWSYWNTNLQNRLLTCLTIANGLTCVGVALGAIHYKKDIPFGNSGTFCIIQSVICTYFDMVADIYTLYVEINICSRIAFGYVFMKRWKAKLLYHGLALCIPLIIVAVGLGRNALGASESLYGSWCWISDSLSHKERWIWMVVTKQGWEVAVYLGTCFMIIIIMYQRYCSRTQRVLPMSPDVTSQNMSTSINVSDERTQLLNAGTRPTSEDTDHISSASAVLVWVGIYFYCAKMWGTVRYSAHIYNLAFDGDISGFVPAEKYFLIFIQSLGDSLQATITCCVFVLSNAKLRKKVCCRREMSTEQSTSDQQT